MDYLPFAAMVIAIAAGLGALAVGMVLPARIRSGAMVAAILGVAAVAFVTDVPRPLYERLFGAQARDGGTRGGEIQDSETGGGFFSRFLEGFSQGNSGALAERHTAQIKAEVRAQNLDWLFDGEADIDSFARQALAKAGNDPGLLSQASARLAGERAKARMSLLHEARLVEVTRVITGMIDSLNYFIDNAQFGNCRTLLLGGYDYPGADPQIMIDLASRLGAAVKSGQRGEKDWVELSAAEIETHTGNAVSHLLENGYTVEQLGSVARLDTNDPAEMESNCRFTRDLFAHLVESFPPEVAASAYVSEL